MSALTIFSDTDAGQPVWQSRDADAIARQLNAINVRFERWQADRDLSAAPSAEEVLAAYQHELDKLVAEKGYQSWDVVSMRADNPQKDALRTKFLSEHTHGEDEVRFFVEGRGCSACTWTAGFSRFCAKRMTCCRCLPACRTGSTWVPSRISPPFACSTTRMAG
ncbi:Acireductone dioxygenase [Dickeya solani]|nr:Acireductone dioxygenase [Dickeya solani]